MGSPIFGLELEELIYIPILKIEIIIFLLLFQQSLELMFVIPRKTANFNPLIKRNCYRGVTVAFTYKFTGKNK